jgi:glycosyltransferase involved in cell wall biosynthesis
LLKQTLAQLSDLNTTIVFSWPWDWPAVRDAPARRRVLDLADDWGEIMPGRSLRFQRHYDEISAAADEIIVVNPELAVRFRDRTPLLIRNGVSEQFLSEPGASGDVKTIVYVGTLTYRFDAKLMRDVLEHLPGWRFEIIGACAYPKLGEQPAPELSDLLAVGDRVRWHGPLERSRVIPWLDRATVCVAPNRPEHALGQDSMKFYDYAARARPIVSTSWFESTLDVPPQLRTADTAPAFAAAIQEAGRANSQSLVDQKAWAAANTWSNRWPLWSSAVFGP